MKRLLPTLLFALVAMSARAQAVVDPVNLPFPLGKSFVTIFCNIAVGVFAIALAASVIAFLVAAYFYLVGASGGSEENVSKGKQALKYAIFGVAVVILAWGAAFIVADLLGGTTATLAGCS